MKNRPSKNLCVFDPSHPLEMIYTKEDYQHLLFWAYGEKHTLYSFHQQSKTIHLEAQETKKAFQELESFYIKRVVLFMDDEVAACYLAQQIKNTIEGVPILLAIHQPSLSDRVFHECGIRTVVRSNEREPLFIIRKHFKEE